MEIYENFILTEHNTFGINVRSKYFTEIFSIKDIKELVKSKEFLGSNTLILGGGSNILFTKDYDGLVINNKIKGKKILS